MAKLFRTEQKLKEGEVFNKWLKNRFLHNKNILSAVTGATGSGKSYSDLRRAELWYKENFDKEFPASNICFSVNEVMKILNTNLKKGEIIIFEEAGANFGSLDFQGRLSKMFNYILQTFRSKNVAVFFNLPYLTMMNKSARMLIHVHFQTCGIDFEHKISKSKAFFRQVNQSSGKIYDKYLRIRHLGKIRTIKMFNYGLPSQRLINIYENKKKKFVSDIINDFTRESEQIEQKRVKKMDKWTKLTDIQRETYDLMLNNDGNVNKVAEIRGVAPRSVYDAVESLKKKGYYLKFVKNPIEKPTFDTSKPN